MHSHAHGSARHSFVTNMELTGHSCSVRVRRVSDLSRSVSMVNDLCCSRSTLIQTNTRHPSLFKIPNTVFDSGSPSGNRRCSTPPSSAHYGRSDRCIKLEGKGRRSWALATLWINPNFFLSLPIAQDGIAQPVPLSPLRPRSTRRRPGKRSRAHSAVNSRHPPISPVFRSSLFAPYRRDALVTRSLLFSRSNIRWMIEFCRDISPDPAPRSPFLYHHSQSRVE